MLFSDERAQLKLYYFFMVAGGDCTKDELKLFSSICKAMGGDKSDRQEAEAFCREAIGNKSAVQNDGYAEMIIRKLSKLLKEEGEFASINSDRETQTKLIWNLFNIGYADTVFSDPEKRIIQYLSNRWKMNKAVISDMTDTAETIFLLTQQEAWVKTTNWTEDAMSKEIHVIKQSINRMKKNIEVLISEAEIA